MSRLGKNRKRGDDERSDEGNSGGLDRLLSGGPAPNKGEPVAESVQAPPPEEPAVTDGGVPPPPSVSQRIDGPPPDAANRPDIAEVLDAEPGAITMSRPVPVSRGPHYVLGFGTDHDGVYGPDVAEDGKTLVTGEVPADYSQVTLECEGGDDVEATFVDSSTLADINFFVALVRRRVERIVATKHGGVYGMFLDLTLVTENG
jgi:hypothetical protein